MIAERVAQVLNSIEVPMTIFQMIIIWGALSFIGFFFVFVALITNRESWFWFWMRFSSKIAVAEFDDTGKVVFKKEKAIGQGVVKGEDDKFDYSITPRNISLDLSPHIDRETGMRYTAYMERITTDTSIPEKDREEALNYTDAEQRTIFASLRKEVVEEYEKVQNALEVATDINKFRAITAGTRTPFFVRYSGKAVLVNPLLATVISGGKYARVLDLKTFIAKMITPSQIKYIASLSEMIGAKQLARNKGVPAWLVIVAIFGILMLIVFYGLPYLGIELF